MQCEHYLHFMCCFRSIIDWSGFGFCVFVQYLFFNLQFGWTSFILLIDSFIAIWIVGAHIFELCVAIPYNKAMFSMHLFIAHLLVVNCTV